MNPSPGKKNIASLNGVETGKVAAHLGLDGNGGRPEEANTGSLDGVLDLHELVLHLRR